MLLSVLMIAIPPLVIPRLINRNLKRARDIFSDAMACYTRRLKDYLGGFELIRTFQKENAYAAEHARASEEAKAAELRYQKSLNWMIVNTSLTSNLIFPIILLVGLILFFDGKITLGTMSTAASLSNFVVTPCAQISQNWAKMKSSRGIRERLETAMMPHPEETGQEINTITDISCENVGYRYPDSQTLILSGINFRIQEGEKVAIIGESGCGKSTLSKLLLQYDTNYIGNIRMNGEEIRTLRKSSLYSRIGYIPQNTYLMNSSIRENICLCDDFSEKEIQRALQSAGISDWVESLPNGLDTVINESGDNLSGGQRQRIGIARAAIRSFDVIIADEVTSNLDLETSEGIMEHLFSLPGMLIAITHATDQNVMAKFDRVINLSVAE